MSHIRYILTTGAETDISQSDAARMVKTYGTVEAREWRDQCGGKLLNFVSIELDHRYGTIEVGYASRAAARSAANAIMEGA